MSSTFSDLGVPSKIIAALGKRDITAPFPIQALTIADALAGKDICGRAPTGSGKTLAFGVPLAALTRKAKPHRPTALVLVPTRELAAQVAETIKPLAQARELSVAAFYGGMSIGKDRQRLDRGVDIAIACPGRLEDLVARNMIDLRDVHLAVLDEADRMADMGFLPVVQRLLDLTSADRQTLLFSATLDGDVDVLVRRYQKNPVRHEMEVSAEDAGDVRHYFWSAGSSDRVRVTKDIVGKTSPAIVFTRTKHGADRVAKQLARDGVHAVAIHGDRTQGQRQRALADFTNGKANVLVATDVAARGIHVDNVSVVVHFDPAGTDKDYVHRSGRTGRAGADGVVVTLVSPDKRKDVQGLQRALGIREPIAAVALGLLAGHAVTERPVRVDPSLRPARSDEPGRSARPGTDRRPERGPDRRPKGPRGERPVRSDRDGAPRGERPVRSDRGPSTGTRAERPVRSDRGPSTGTRAERPVRSDRGPSTGTRSERPVRSDRDGAPRGERPVRSDRGPSNGTRFERGPSSGTRSERPVRSDRDGAPPRGERTERADGPARGPSKPYGKSSAKPYGKSSSGKPSGKPYGKSSGKPSSGKPSGKTQGGPRGQHQGPKRRPSAA